MNPGSRMMLRLPSRRLYIPELLARSNVSARIDLLLRLRQGDSFLGGDGGRPGK